MNKLVRSVGIMSAAVAFGAGSALVAPMAVAQSSLPGSSEASPTVKPAGACAQNFIAGNATTPDKWEITWGRQHDETGVAAWTSKDHGGIKFTDPGTLKTPEQELAAIKSYDAANTGGYRWWYPSRDMVNNGASMTIEYEDGFTVVGEVAVGTDNCPSVKWTSNQTITPADFPEQDEDGGLFGSVSGIFQS